MRSRRAERSVARSPAGAKHPVLDPRNRAIGAGGGDLTPETALSGHGDGDVTPETGLSGVSGDSGLRASLQHPRGHAVQHDAEVGAVSRQYLVILGQEMLLPFTVGRLDKRPVADGNSAVLSEPRADQGPGEMRLRRGLLPPGGGLEVAQLPGPRLDSVLGLAVHEDVEVAVSGIGYPERSAGVALLRANVHI